MLSVAKIQKRSWVVAHVRCVLSLLLNLLWIAFGGLEIALGWLIAAVIMAITIIGLPWARAAFNIAAYTLLPFGQKAVLRAEYSDTKDIGTGPLGPAVRLMARPTKRLLHPVLESHDGRAAVPSPKRSRAKLRERYIAALTGHQAVI